MKKFFQDENLIKFFCVLGFLMAISATPFIYIAGAWNKNVVVPKNTNAVFFDNLPIRAGAVAVFDTTNGKFIYSKNGNSQLPLASITKVMSSVSALRIAERMNNDKPVKFAGKWWNMFDLMKFALVSSSNSGVTSIAEAMSKVEDARNSEEAKIDFVKEMNDIAKELNLSTVYFLNETGLDINENLGGAYGSAKDIAKMFSYAVRRYPNIFNATKYPEIKIVSIDGEEKVSKNTNVDVSKITTLIASKTGTTDLAGGNLVIAFDAGLSHPIIISVLGSTPEDRFKDMELLAKATVEALSK